MSIQNGMLGDLDVSARLDLAALQNYSSGSAPDPYKRLQAKRGVIIKSGFLMGRIAVGSVLANRRQRMRAFPSISSF